jgi:hypothetical protein
MTSAATLDPDTGGRLAKHRFGPALEPMGERGGPELRGTTGRSRLSVETGVSALDGYLGQLSEGVTPTGTPLGGSATMSLQTLNPLHGPGTSSEAPSEISMRLMETGLAFVAIVVALLLNLGR